MTTIFYLVKSVRWYPRHKQLKKKVKIKAKDSSTAYNLCQSLYGELGWEISMYWPE